MIGAYLVVTLLAFSVLYAIQLYYNKSFMLKLINVTVLVFISSAVYFTFETYKGWPTLEKLHDKARVFGIIIEPPVKGKSDGAIYYWVVEKERVTTSFERIFRYVPTMPNAPRSYHLPYSPEAEKKFAEAQQALQEGKVVLMDPNDQQSEGGGKEGDQGNGDSKKTPSDGGHGEEKNYDVPSLEILSPEVLMGKQRQ